MKKLLLIILCFGLAWSYLDRPTNYKVPSTEAVAGHGLAPTAPAPPSLPKQIRVFDTEKVISLTNLERAKRGLKPVRKHSRVTWSAKCKVDDIVLYNYWSHGRAGRDWFDCFRLAGLKWGGENLAKCYPTPQAVVKSWMKSASHRSNLLTAGWTGIGVSASWDEDIGCFIVVQHFN